MAECKLPREMVVEIFLRLPPKSLMRFKCIHKSWNSLINSRHVVDKHFHFHNNQTSSTTILLRRCVTHRETRNEDVVHSLLTLRNENNGDEDNLHYEIEDIHFPPAVGLKTRAQFIENPGPNFDCAAIREFKVIPEPCLPGLRELLYRSEAFGYDPNSEDFFIVVVAGYGHYNDGGIEERLTLYPQRAEMYTMRTDSWEEINIHNLENETTMFRPYNFQVYLKGKCYYLALEISKEFMSSFDSLEEMGRAAIIWFDTSDRVFHTALTPDPLYRYPAHDFELAVWNNSVAVFGYHREGSQPFEIWVMGKFDGFTCEWIKHLSIDIMESPLSLVLWEGNQSLLVSPRVRVALYSFATKTSKYFPIYASDYFYAIPVVNSIAPLNRDLICADIS
ncbi:PREDICTED: uncharacterized protein LOC101311783 [Fragaria vesca subsp. vesca]